MAAAKGRRIREPQEGIEAASSDEQWLQPKAT
jgi:hypothetical protein